MKENGNYISEISDENAKFCIIALTGKVRAGTSDVCTLLTDPDFPDTTAPPADTSTYEMSEIREFNIIQQYLQHNWRPFIHLSITDIIVSFILESNVERMKEEIVDTEKMGRSSIFKVISEAAKNIRKEEAIQKAIKVSNTLQNKRNWRREERIEEDKIKEVCEQNFSLWGEDIFNTWEKIRNSIYNEKEISLDNFIFCFGYLPILRIEIRSILGKNNYTIAFQKYGNNIRAYGKAIVDTIDCDIDYKKVFLLPERANKFIKLLRYYNQITEDDKASKMTGTKNPVFVVINNFKNIFEAYYFKKRYSAFYLMAVSCDENMRRERFEDVKKFKIAELRENLSSGKRIYNKVKKIYDGVGNLPEMVRVQLGLLNAEFEFAQEIYNEENNLQKKAYDRNIASFILQDVVTCVENADIFVTRNYEENNYRCDYSLIRQLARIVTLLLHPGLLTPTKVERCMQIAMAAKLNSGCLSRQVGAVVTDNNYNILSIGWNDAPCGDESCIRRNLYDLVRKYDADAYSEYELNDEEFRGYLDKVGVELKWYMKELKGLPLAFCFKDIYQDMIMQRDQIYTRALHGEERALVSCDKIRANGGYLFTTSSPCELCAKKARDTGISKIYYIEQYPGISRSHIINYGNQKTWAKYELFAGAIGTAYAKLYTPIIPYKDELAILGFSPKKMYDRDRERENLITQSSDEAIPKMMGGEKKRNRYQETQETQDDYLEE